MMFRVLALIAGFAFSCLGCADVDGPEGCVAGQTAVCGCEGGRSGVQSCDAAGRFGVCRCEGGTACTPQCSGRVCGDDGCGGRCGSCGLGSVCDAGRCAVDPGSRWVLTAQSGTVTERDGTNQSWDAAGGLPDPLLCLSVNGNRECTRAVADTLMPRWGHRFAPQSAASLRAGVTFAYDDEDLTDDDVICSPTTVRITDEMFTRGGLTMECSFGTFSLSLAPAPF